MLYLSSGKMYLPLREAVRLFRTENRIWPFLCIVFAKKRIVILPDQLQSKSQRDGILDSK